MKIPVSIQREIARMISLEISNRKIGAMLNISPTTVSCFRKLFNVCGRTYDDVKSLDDEAFSAVVGSKTKQYKTNSIVPNWEQIQDELRGDNVTLSLLWQEYLQTNRDSKGRCLSYSQFQRRYKSWVKTQRISMRQFHLPGEKMFVDFCGQTMPITNPKTGEVTKAQIFVAVLGGSSYTFACAVDSQKTSDWITCHMEAFKYFQGVPRQVVTDNLKAAIIKNTKHDVIVNHEYELCAEYYGFQINPTRVRKPKDKGLVEVAVQIVQRWILARLRNRRFFSLDELNKAIIGHLDILNKKETKVYKRSRHQRYIEIDKSALKTLPAQDYDISSWVYQIKIPEDYHVKYGESYYSVPHQYRFKRVDLRIIMNTLEIISNRQCIASHLLRQTPGKSTIASHMPEAHYRQSMCDPVMLIAWAENIGPNIWEWVRRNLEERKNFANGLKSVKNLQKLIQDERSYAKFDAACEVALEYNMLTFQSLKRIAANKGILVPHRKPVVSVKDHANLRGAEYYRKQEGQA